MTEPIIWWIRRDLRLHDNPILAECMQTNRPIIPVFILDDRLLNSQNASSKRSAFLLECLHRLDASLRARGSYLVIRRGDAQTELTRLRNETSSCEILAEPDYSPFAIRRDRKIENVLPVRWAGSPGIHPPGSVLKPDGMPYTIFTAFSKAWKSLPAPQVADYPVPKFIPTPPAIESNAPIEGPSLSDTVPFTPGEGEGTGRLQVFIAGEGINHYQEMRNRIDLEGTSKLSPYLRFGMISARRAASAALEVKQASQDQGGNPSAEAWMNELIWRDFFIHILYHFPSVYRENFRQLEIRWENNLDHFQAWCEGQTGYPIVDAAMRSLVSTGWMHNRARMIVASFLTKDLFMDWRWGEKWFMQHLLDGDPASNNGGWQWTAGTGTDAAPYYRIFNPTLQSRKFDPHGDFIRRWLPELADLPDKFIHNPTDLPLDLQRRFGFKPGRDYPLPVVDHHLARQRTLNAYAASRHTVPEGR